MTTQSVITQAANQFGNAAGNVTVKGKQSGSDFNLFIDSSLKATQKTAVNSDAAVKKTSTPVTDAKSSSNSDKTDAAEAKTNSVQKDAASKTDTSKTAVQKSDTKSDASKVTVKEEDETSKADDSTDNSQLMAKIAGMLQSIQEAVMKALNLSSEEFNQLLTEQGMNAADLLQPESLQQLILANSGQTDILAALTDENLADTMKQLLQTVEDMKTENNLGLTSEQIKSMLAQSEGQSKAKLETVKESVTEKQTANQQEDPTEQSEVVNASNGTKDNNTKNVTKTVTEKSVTAETVKPAVTSESLSGSQSGTGSEADNGLNSSNQFQTIVDNLVKASSTTQVDFSGEMVQVTEIRQIANQIIDRIKVSIMPNQTSMELQLNPENLGKVNLSVQSKNGEMTAHFIVQNEISKEAIESQMQTLKDTLNQQGIKVDSIEVTVSANAFEQSSKEGSNNETDTQKDNSGKKITLEEALNMTEAIEDETSTQDATGITGSMIDYTA